MQIPYPQIPPEIIRIGPVAIRWYGIMYVIGYVVGYRVARGRIARGLVALDKAGLDSFVGYLVVGMLVGARLTYAIIYDRGHYLSTPLDILKIWRGGLSFHGAVIGMTAASAIFARVRQVPFWDVADTLALAGTPGLFFGRIGNFINAELYGRPSHVPWAMIFPTDSLGVPRHPSQLYEAFAEGIFLFMALRWIENRGVRYGWYRPGILTAAFLVGYGVIRFLLEFTRQPDQQLGLVLGPFSMGQLLSATMIVFGLVLLAVIRGRSPHHAHVQ
ncbi:MAG TPA: prolipoprotein diacylglyceryl transferase [Gemmatimonadaceae bacterium]|jgi:phosphatidylglycerol:prolipoprotein diacylglycerol transferase|nr:prolipoprotein diacylglyceryl transferase [Gemmatimonadaceae bacterium]